MKPSWFTAPWTRKGTEMSLRRIVLVVIKIDVAQVLFGLAAVLTALATLLPLI